MFLLAVTLVGGSSVWAAAQTLVNVQWDRDDREAYREGYRQGRWDANRGRRVDWHGNRCREADDRAAYRNGYLRGYREVSGYYSRQVRVYYRGDGDRDGYLGSARHLGYQDGYYEGARDRRTGHSFRPTYSDRYEDADRGYDGRFGDKTYYKQVYRKGYRQGYDRGYNLRG
jgi:hypothetical protein